jgi:hypothetical protein
LSKETEAELCSAREYESPHSQAWSLWSILTHLRAISDLV